MVTSQTSKVLQHLRQAALLRDGAGLSDGQLLGCFLEHRDEAAFATLVKRHGPMVWGVCHRLLNPQDAEDAFQATFLVLVRKAATVVPREMVGNWLYGVAHQTVLHARRTAARRKGRERQVANMPEPAVTDEDRWPDLQSLLDEELSRLPDNYRAVIILCDLEGKTRKEVARQLGVPDGSVAGWLARARAMLAKRLTQRGIALSGGALTAVLAQQAVSAGVPDSVVDATLKAASLSAPGKTASAGAISAKVAALTEGVMKAMLFTKLKTVIAVVLVLGIVATGTTILTSRTAAGQADKKRTAEIPVEPPARQEKEKQAFTAWGKEVGVLRAGLGFRSGEHRSYHHGEAATVVLRVRNVGKEAVEFKHIWAFFVENPPTIRDADGKRVPLPRFAAEGLHMPRSTRIASGQEVELYAWKFDLRPKGERSPSNTAIHGTGKFSLQCERIVGPTSCNPNHPNPALGKLATGKLELNVKPAPVPAASRFPVGWGGGGKDYELSVDKAVRHGGKASASIKSIVPTPLWYGAFTQAFRADKCRGQRLRMTAYVKSRGVENSAGLWMRIEGFDGKGNYSLSSDYMGDRPIKGTNDWKQYEVVLDVPKEGAAQIAFGMLLAGKGQVWVDDFKFEAVGNAVKTTGKAREMGKAAGGLAKGLPREPKNLDFEQ